MKITKITSAAAAFSAAMLLTSNRSPAQDSTPSPSASVAPAASATASPTPTAAPDQGGRRWNMQDFRQRMNDRIKAALKATDDEWAVIQPLLEAVQTKQFELRGFGGFGGRGGRPPGGGGGGQGGGPGAPGGGPGGPGGGPGGPGGPGGGPGGGGSPESQALRTALDSDSTSVDEIKSKLQALRDSRKKVSAELEQARQNLEKVLTLRQEATLVMMGILE